MIAADSIVVVRMNEDRSAHTLKVSGKQKLFKRNVDVTCLVGQPYGCIFELQGDSLVRVAETELFDEKDIVDVKGDETEGVASTASSSSVTKGDNRNFTDTNTAQKLSQAQVMALRSSGVKGEDIIQRLVQNSETWDKKTDYAQEKYLKKKKKKYLKRFRIVESTPLTLCEVYESKSRDKICAMRPDTLSHLLSHSGVYAGCRALIFDGILGLLVGTVALRMAGEGLIMALYEGQQPRAEAIDFLNLPDDSAAIIQPASTVELGPANKDVVQKGFYSDKKRKIDELGPEAAIAPLPKGNDAPPKKVTKPYLKSGRQHAEGIRIRQWLREGFHSLIIASRYDPLPILKTSIPLLHSSAPIVIYSEHVELLNECFLYLHNNNLAVRLTISENWLRFFQTLPGREHPENFMRASGGFVLSGIRVNSTGVSPSGSQAGK